MENEYESLEAAIEIVRRKRKLTERDLIADLKHANSYLFIGDRQMLFDRIQTLWRIEIRLVNRHPKGWVLKTPADRDVIV